MRMEGFSSEVYACTAGYDTIGYGKRVDYLNVTKQQAKQWLKQDLEDLHNIVTATFDWFVFIDPVAQDIVMNMCYQLGIRGFSKFRKTIQYLENKNYKACSEEMLDSKWARNDSPNRAKELSDRMASIDG